LKAGTATPPPVVETLKLGLIDDWGPGWVRKRWEPSPQVLNGDGSMFGGYTAALADQALSLAAISVLDDASALRTINLQVQFFKLAGA
ncbi:PaaI family thioesterase, partial [Staphylococcus aureus]|nr:PaaI family thioesterase [Staphylococcus aureus]